MWEDLPVVSLEACSPSECHTTGHAHVVCIAHRCWRFCITQPKRREYDFAINRNRSEKLVFAACASVYNVEHSYFRVNLVCLKVVEWRP